MSYHLIGMGGIGMSALARVLLQQGERVHGSDIRKSALLEQLSLEGALVDPLQTGEMLEEGCTVVYSTDISRDNLEMQKAASLRLKCLHRSDLLNQLIGSKKSLLVTGTHGKTTTTALLAAVLLEARMDPSFVIGGYLRSLNTNGRAGRGEYFVAEADESDGSFLKTCSYGAIVTNLEAEHLSYWKTLDRLRAGFQQFFEQSNHLFWCADDPELSKLSPKGLSYGFTEKADWQIARFCPTDTGVSFDLIHQGNIFRSIQLALYGRHNALNSAAVFALCHSLGIEEGAVRRAFATFSGTGRRLEFLGSAQQIEVFDDYAHHPTEIRATLSAIRHRILEKRLVVLFQPHRYSRVKDHFEEFIASFSEADELYLTDIYAAGEAPMEGISSASLYMRLREKLGAKVRFFPRPHLEAGCAPLLRPGDVVITLGAGDITSAGRVILGKIQELQPKLTVGVLYGGESAEHDVSIASAKNVLSYLDSSIYTIKQFKVSQEGQWSLGAEELHSGSSKLPFEIMEELTSCDVCIPVFHGPRGEDGMMQGLLDALGMPYAACDYRSSALCMQKAWTKQVSQMRGIPTAPFFEWTIAFWKERAEALLEEISRQFSFPVWIKPVHLGSSIGVMRANSEAEALAAATLAFSYDDVIVVEKEIVGRQIEFALLGNEWLRVAPPGEVLNEGQFYDYEGKYGSSALPTKAPADLPPSIQEIGIDLAKQVYRACGCTVLARIDFFLDEKGCYWLNEVNPFPGLTDTSLYPKMWAAAGVSWSALFHEIVILALHRHRKLHAKRGSL